MRVSTELLSRLLAGIEQELPAAVELRHRLHAQPELAHAEEQTAAMVAAALPVECQRAAGTGRIARVGSGGGAAVAVRAELDGLPIAERTGAPFSAMGNAMHACGHDVHMAALVALTRAAHAIEVRGEELPAPLLAVFQPSEEAYPSGAEQLARGELAGEAPGAIVAAHVHPELRWGTVAIDGGAVNASCDAVEVTVEGEPTHGAYPHHGRDPILALAQIVVALHAQVGRRVDPLHPATVTIGVVEGGSAENVIPARARAKGALRAHRPEDRGALRAMVEEIVTGIAAAHGCRGSVELTRGEPALENDRAIVAAARELLGSAGLEPAPEWRSCGSDDFAFFAEVAPIAMAFVGLDGAEGFKPRPLHHPELLVPDSAVGAVARVQALLYVAAASTL
jgi:amidohydrolase